MRQQIPLVIVLAAAVTSGCGKSAPVGEVEGIVTLRGKPLDGIHVTFLPDPGLSASGPMAIAVTDERGWYKLRTVGENQTGIVLGHYRVTLGDLQSFQPRSGRDEAPAGNAASSRIPTVYADPNLSPLLREVKAGPQTIDLEIERSN